MTIRAITELNEEVFTETEFLNGECPDCREIFQSDEELLNHVCEERITEY